MGALPRLLAPILLAAAAHAAPVQDRLAVPANDGWVTDLAGMLSPEEERELESLMESYKQGSGHEIALLTIPSLRGESLERFALEVGRAWGMGSKEKSDAALLLVSKEDRKIRIEVARGLEGSLTDSIAGRIIREEIAPEFKRQRFGAGMRAGIVAMHQAIGGQYAKASRPTQRAPTSGLAGIIPAFVLLFILLAVLSRTRRLRRRGGFSGGSSLPWLLMGMGGGGGGRSFGGGGFSGFGGGGGFSGGGASGGW